MGKTTQTVLEIDLNALRHNYQYLTSKIKSDTKVLGVVKAFGYGSDAIEIAKELSILGADYLAVAYIKEGVALRDGGIKSPIIVLHPQISNLDVLIERCLEPALYSSRILRGFIETAQRNSQVDYPVHIKFNTGLNRLGFGENDVALLCDDLLKTKAIKVKSIFSHLAASDDLLEKEFTQNQINSFKKISEEVMAKLNYTPLLHQSNTSAILNFPEANFDMVRAGIGLYGYGNSEEEDSNLKPVVALKSLISQIHNIGPGESVGYNRAYISKGSERTATIPIGHADGISRLYGNGVGHVLINDKKAPIIGNVCMDMMMVNVTDIDCQEGDEVIIIGDGNSSSQIAEHAGTISYELLTALSQRIPRIICRK